MIQGKTYTEYLKLPFYLQYWLKSRNETFKQTLILAIAKNCFNRNGMANAMPIQMVKTALYPIIIQFDEDTIELM